MKNACQKTVFCLSMVMITYVVYFLYMAYYKYVVPYNINQGDIRESTLIIPLFLMQLPLLIASGVQWIADRFKIKTYSFWSVIILLVGIILTLAPMIIRLSKVLPPK